jgi:UDP-N-acetylmuramate--alanine ligase
VQALNIEMKNFTASYDLAYKGYKLGKISMHVTGKHNIQNSLLAATIGLELDLPFKSIQDGMAAYSGVYSIFELKGEEQWITVYDDYAQHPPEIIATLEGFKDSVDRALWHCFNRICFPHQGSL